MDIVIRAIQKDDAAAVSRLSAQLGYDMPPAATEQVIDQIMDSPSDMALVATDGEAVVAWIHVFHTIRLESAPFCEIGGLVTDEHYRSRGIGKQLITHALPWCHAKGCRSLRVRSNTKRVDGHRFYLQAGFREVKEQKVFEIGLPLL
jgi:GNAT superfamily N-acetyltransferase